MQHAQNRETSSEKTPETISKAVASLPPEQMFELLKQMKQCVQVRKVPFGWIVNLNVGMIVMLPLHSF